jgi:hypothetical protein
MRANQGLCIAYSLHPRGNKGKKRKERKIIVQIIQKNAKNFQLMTLPPSYGDFLRNIPNSHPAKAFFVLVKFSRGQKFNELNMVAKRCLGALGFFRWNAFIKVLAFLTFFLFSQESSPL